MSLSPPPPARIFGTNREEILELSSWLQHAPPEKGEAQWKDGYSAKEQAKAWLRHGSPQVPQELWSAVAALIGDADLVRARPEHTTRLDKFSRARQHDMLACFRRDGGTVLLAGVEAKACEGFDGLVRDRAAAAQPSNKRARCNLLARALFNRDVVNEQTGEVLDAGLAGHGYQLWTAAVGTIIEAQQRDLAEAVLIVHQFRPEDLDAAATGGDRRDWQTALDVNQRAFEAFASAIEDAGGVAYETPFVRAGTRLHLVKVETRLAPLRF